MEPLPLGEPLEALSLENVDTDSLGASLASLVLREVFVRPLHPQFLAALTLLVAASVAASSPPPQQAEIAVDGQFEDWVEVLTNPRNATRDGDGSTIPCPESTDRDCDVGGSSLDLSRFAWTWDAQSLFVYFERFAYEPIDKHYFVAIDADRDSLLERDEPVIDLTLGFPDIVAVGRYRPASPGGDPLLDPDGWADGHAPPGSVIGTVATGAAARSFDYLRLEAGVPWSDLGLAPGAAFNYHVGSSAGAASMIGTADNLGGPDGRKGTTAYLAVRAEPDRAFSSAPGVTLSLAHSVRNDGNLPTLYRLRATSTAGFDLTFWSDPDGDGNGDVYLGTDAGGDGLMFLPGDDVAPAGDSDADGVLDTGVLEPGAEFGLVIEETPPLGASGVVERVEIVAWHPSDNSLEDRAHDRISLGAVGLVADERRLAAAGDVAWFPHVLGNHAGATVDVSLALLSGLGWPSTLFEDPDADGDPADALLLSDTDGDGNPDLSLADGESRALLVRVDVPSWQALDSSETTIVRATVDGTVEAAVFDQTSAAEPLELAPDHLLVDTDARYGAAGGRIYFSHRLVSARGMTDTYDLAAVSDRGWPVLLLADPDGDGRPYDAAPLLSPSVTLERNGGIAFLLLRVDVPPGNPVGETSRIRLTATSRADPAVTARAEDDAVVAIVRLYEDAGHVVNITRSGPCSTLHARADNLPPSDPGARFVWRNPAGQAVQLSPVSTDAFGACNDAYTLQPGQVGAGWSVDLQLSDGMGYLTQDAARFDVTGPLEVTELASLRPSLDLLDVRFDATALVRNPSFDPAPAGVRLRWVVLSPDGSLHLDSSGEFLAYSGTESTGIETVSVPQGGNLRLTWSVTDVSWPVDGSYSLEAWLADGCGGDSLAAGAGFLVIDDPDGDGLSSLDELIAGSDPEDADSDDDGLTDRLDGLTDSDGDGVIDALDCDSDDDGLSDGLEAGVSTRGADTDPGSSCFAADSDPSSTTNPDVADTDGGGVPDGFEDEDRDGAVDSAERDPNDPGDDTAGCAADLPPEVTGLRVAHSLAAVLLRWDGVSADPCTGYTLLRGESATGLGPVAEWLTDASFADAGAGGAGPTYYLVQAVSTLGGPGPTGR